jgi:hypothetical protein
MRSILILLFSILLNFFCFAQKTEKIHGQGELFSGVESKKSPEKKVVVKKVAKKKVKKVTKKKAKKPVKKSVKKVDKKTIKKTGEHEQETEKIAIEKEGALKALPEKLEGKSTSKKGEKKASVAKGFVNAGETYQVPTIGDILFEKTSKKGIYEGRFKEPKDNIGPLGVKDFVLVSDNLKKQISCNVPVKLGHISGKMSVEKIEKNKEYIFSVTLDTPIEIPADKDSNAKVNNFTLTINDKGVSLVAQLKIGVQEKLSLVIDNDISKESATISIGELSVGNLLSSKDEKLIKCLLKEPKGIVTKLFTPHETVVTFEGATDCTALFQDFVNKDLGKKLEKIDISKLVLNISITEKAGVNIQYIFNEDFVITPNMFFIKNPKLTIGLTEGLMEKSGEKADKYELKITGDATLTGLQDMGLKEAKSFASTIDYKDGKFSKIFGVLKEKIDYLGLIVFEGPAFEYDIPKKAWYLTKEINILGFSALTKIERVLEKDTLNNTESYKIYVKGMPKQKEIKLFGGTGIPEIEDIAIVNPIFVIVKGIVSYIAVRGTLSMFGKSLDIEVAKKKDRSGAARGWLITADLGEKISLGTFMPFVKGTFLDSFSLLNNKLVISTTAAPYMDEELKVFVKKGICLLTDLNLDVIPFNVIKKVIPIIPNKVRALVSLAKPKDMSIAIPLGLQDVSLGNNITMKNFDLILSLKGFGIRTTASVKPSPSDDLTFILNLIFGPTDASLAGTMMGTWNNPLGLPGLIIENVAAEVGIKYAVPPIPSAMGFTGTMQIGDVKATVATKMSTPNPKDPFPDVMIYGKVNELSFKSILSMAQIVGLKIPAPNLPLMSLRDVEIKFAPKDGQIGEIPYYKGIGMKGTMGIFDVDATLDLRIPLINLPKVKFPVPTGIFASGSMSPIDLKILKIAGKGPRGGPIISLELSPQVQKFILSSYVSLGIPGLSMSQATDVKLGSDGMEFSFVGKLLGAVDSQITGRSSGGFGKDMDFTVRADSKASGIFTLKKEDLQDAKNKFDKLASDSIEGFKRDIDRLQKKVDEEVKKMEDSVAPYRALMSTVRTLQKVFNDAREKSDALKRRLDEKKAELSRWGFIFDPLEDWKRFDIVVPDYYKYLTSADEALGLIEPVEVWDQFDVVVPDYYKYVMNNDPFELTDLYMAMSGTPEMYTWGFFRSICRAVSSAARTVGQSVAKAATVVASNVVILAKKAEAAAEIAALGTAYAAAQAVLFAAEKTLRIQEEALKNFNPFVVRWRAEQVALVAKLSAEQVLYRFCQGLLLTAISTYPAVRVFTPVKVNRISFQIALRNPIPKVEMDVNILGVHDVTLKVTKGLDDIPGLLREVFIDNIGQILKLKK